MVTHNTTDFQNIPGLRLDDWLTPLSGAGYTARLRWSRREPEVDAPAAGRNGGAIGFISECTHRGRHLRGQVTTRYASRSCTAPASLPTPPLKLAGTGSG